MIKVMPIRRLLKESFITMGKFTQEVAAGQEESREVRKALPELQLTELQKSEKPINDIEGKKLKVEAVRPWNNYTIVTLEGSDEIQIFDEDARVIPEFTKPLNSKKVKVEWASYSVAQKLGPRKGYIGEDTKNAPDMIKISEVPLELRGFARVFLATSSGGEIKVSVMPATEFTASDVVVLDKYIILTTKEGGYFAYVTKNENGVVLAPQNWQRIDWSKPVPPELNKYAERILGEHEGYKQLNDRYSALITDVGINIVENNKVKGAPVFSDLVPSVERNVAIDPTNPNVIYYCQSSNPRNIKRIDLSAEPNTWGVVAAELPQKYDSISNLQLDPSGNFFLLYSKEDLVILTRDGLQEVKRVPKLTQVNFDAAGKIRAVDKDGRLAIYEPNFEELAQEIDRHRVEKLAAGIQLQDIFDLRASKKSEKGGEVLERLEPLRAKYQEQFGEVLARITTQDGVRELRQGFNKLRDQLRRHGLKPNEVNFIIEGLEVPIVEKEKEFAVRETQEVLTSVRAKLTSSLSITSISEARAEVDKIKAVEALLEGDLRQEFRQVVQEFEQKSLEFFHQRGGEVIKDVRGLLERTKTDLEAFTSKIQMDDWLEFRYPQLKSRLGSLAHDVPLEADEAYKAIVSARTELQELATQFEEKFKREYAKVREKAVERIEGTVDTLESDIGGLIGRLRSKGFADRRAAEQYLDTSEARRTLETEITALAGNNPDIAKELERALKVRLSNALTEIERGGMTQVAETGQQMILFGETSFPKWEAKVKEKGERKVDLVFDEDEKTHGPGIKAGDILGDVAINIKTSTGKAENVRPYEGWQDENEWRLGLFTYRGESIPPSYVTAADYKTIKKEYSDWSLGERSKLQTELQEKRNTLKEIYSRRQKIGEKTPDVDSAWQEEYKAKLQEYATFVAEHHIPLLKRIDRIKAEPEVEYTNGKGYVPEWQSHWVNDPQTEKDLEEMAKALKMQLDLQEGMLNLKGHAGTGKDVRMKMFCALTNRPYFGIDGTKWTTEFELSEDVMLESKDGASQTVKVPSAVLNGITTPGAVVYFNEFNAMPEQAQIFLHALMDEKRSLTLKTSSGKVIRANPSVLLASSMNPGYPGTFDPQFATRSRMVSIEVGYPPLTRKPEAGDTNLNPPYDSSEALRIARGVDSLSDLTYEASLERNEFVKMWDKYVNGIENGSPDPNGTQKFDIDTSLALVQFADNLRENFIKIFEKSRDARNALPVSQPITGRELRRAAYELSKMTPEEKATANPEAIARNLLDKYFLTHIDKKEDRDKIRTAMNTWTSKKRVRA
ncbi:MAG TPA: AAA family ATPase [Candidatus Paceibacterota bacterium]